jgi:hypothetical protein
MHRYTGGCSCGSVRYELRDHPLWINACHCNACKKRTGSAFGISMVVDASVAEEFTGPVKTFTRTGDSGKQVHYEFCPNCGTTVRWQVDIVPNTRIYAGGTLDESQQLKVIGEIYAAEALPFARLGCELTTGGVPDEAFRAAVRQKAAASR